MIISNKPLIRALAAIALCTLTGAHADVVKLVQDDALTGTISALNNEGVTITSTLTPTPIEIKADKITKITFDSQQEARHQHTEQVTLANGDILPCRVTSMDDDSLLISTWYAGKLLIPRHSIQSLQFGISTNQVIYQGTDAPTEWTSHKGQWSYSNSKGYTCQGVGTLARQLEQTENLHINFDLTWQSNPNFTFRFCAENNKAHTKQNAYEFTFNSAGINLRRVLKNQTPSPLTSIARKPHEISKQQVNIDLLVNRALGEITLHIDGQMFGRWSDNAEATEGNYIILNDGSNQANGFHINNLVISNWMGGSQPRYQEKLSQGKEDIMIDSEGEILSGQLKSISQTKANNRIIHLKPRHSGLIQVPEYRISTLIFAAQTDNPKHSPAHYNAQFVGGGTIQLKNPQLTDGKITIHHSILGPIRIDITSVSSITVQPSASE